MTLIDFIAIVGALAWIPPIFVALRSWMTRPEIRVITQNSPEIGFTSMGPILNLRVALTAKHKDIVITGIRLTLTHESGAELDFSWRGIVQRIGTMTHPEVGTVPFEKEHNVLALKVSLKDVEERFVRFQNLDYISQKNELETFALKKLDYLQRSGTFDGENFLASQEMTELYAFIRQSFEWKHGGYRMKVKLESPDAFAVIDDEYSFTLLPMQIQQISENLQLIERSFAAEIIPAQVGAPPNTLVWRWIYPEMTRINH